MDSGWAGAVGTGMGAFIGLLGGLATTWMNNFLAKPKPDPHDATAKDYLRSVFDADPSGWYSIYGLGNMVGIADTAQMARLLLDVGARGSVNSHVLWGLARSHPLDAGVPASTTDPHDPAP